MQKKILFLSKDMLFMKNAIKKKLEAAGYEIIDAEPTVAALEKYRADTDFILFLLGAYVSDIADVLVYLKDICTEEDKMLLLLGNPGELDEVAETVPPALAAARFTRPVATEKIIEELNRLREVSAETLGRKHILLVDDDASYLKMVKSWLAASYRVTVVTSGAQAMMYLAKTQPDLILLDYQMPVTSGPQVLEMIRSEDKLGSIPVVFLTGKGDRDSVLSVLALKPDGYLLKSTDKTGLLKYLGDFFEKQKYQKLHEEA